MTSLENIKPLGDRVLVKPTKNEDKTESGIYIPETASKDKPEQGKVLAVGPGETNEQGEVTPMKVTVGQTVMFTKYSPNEIEIGNETYLIIREKDILAIVE